MLRIAPTNFSGIGLRSAYCIDDFDVADASVATMNPTVVYVPGFNLSTLNGGDIFVDLFLFLYSFEVLM